MNDLGEKIGAAAVVIAGTMLWLNGVQNGWTIAMIVLGVLCAL